MEKLQELFNRIFSGDGEDNSPALLKIIFGGKRKKSLPKFATCVIEKN